MSRRGHRFVHLGLGYDDEAVLGEPRSSVPGLISNSTEPLIGSRIIAQSCQCHCVR